MRSDFNLRTRVSRVVNDADSGPGRLFDLSVQVLILISLVGFSVETLPELSMETRTCLQVTEKLVVGVFVVEYLLRVWTADRRLRFIFSFYGLIDLVAILPYLVASGLDLRSVRAFRMFRILQMLKLGRYTRALERFRVAFLLAREELVLFSVVTLLLLWLAAVGIYYFESEAQPTVFASVFHSLWWAVSTLTTVGYGDVYPITVGGKLFTFVVLMLGLGIVAVPAGLFAASLSKVDPADLRSRGTERRMAETDR